MSFLYLVLEAALLLIPVAGLILVKYMPAITFIRITTSICIILLIHNTLFLTGLSVNNFHFNYTIFAVELPLLALLMYNYVKVRQNKYTTILSTAGFGILSTCIIIGLFGTFIFADIANKVAVPVEAVVPAISSAKAQNMSLIGAQTVAQKQLVMVDSTDK